MKKQAAQARNSFEAIDVNALLEKINGIASITDEGAPAVQTLMPEADFSDEKPLDDILLKPGSSPISSARLCAATRIYKQSYSNQKSYDMIVKGECGVFNPKIMRCFQHVREQLEEYSDRVR